MILTHEFIDIFTLKEYFIHLLEDPADDVTWLRIKQPGTYTIFLISSVIMIMILILFHLSYTQETR